MKPEIEAVFTDIDKEKLRSALKNAGANLKVPERKMVRTVFKTDPLGTPREKSRSFLRVRDEGDKVVVTYKKFLDDTATGVRELNLTVADYDQAVELFRELKLHEKSYEESCRETWELDGAEIDIDTWPWIPSYVEIEGQSLDHIGAVAVKLGFDMQNAVYDTVGGIYEKYYEVSRDDINAGKGFWNRIEFTDIPAELEAKRKN